MNITASALKHYDAYIVHVHVHLRIYTYLFIVNKLQLYSPPVLQCIIYRMAGNFRGVQIFIIFMVDLPVTTTNYKQYSLPISI